MPTKKQNRLLDTYGSGKEGAKQFPAMIRLNPIQGKSGFMGVMYQDVADLKDPSKMLQDAYRGRNLADGYRGNLGFVTDKQAALLEKNAMGFTDEAGHKTISAKVNLVPAGDTIGIDFGSATKNAYAARQIGNDPSRLPERFDKTAEITKEIASLRKPIFDQIAAERDAAAKVAQNNKAKAAAEKPAEKSGMSAEEKAARRAERNAAVNERRAEVATEFTGDDAKRASLICTLHPKKGAEGSYYMHTYFNTALSDRMGDLSGHGAVVDQAYVDAMAEKVPVSFDADGKGVFATKATLVKADATAPLESGRDVYMPDVETAQKDGQVTKLLNSGEYGDMFEVAEASRDKVVNAREAERAEARAAKAAEAAAAEPTVEPAIETPEASEPDGPEQVETEDDMELC